VGESIGGYPFRLSVPSSKDGYEKDLLWIFTYSAHELDCLSNGELKAYIFELVAS